MGSRAERKQRRLDKIAGYKEEIKSACMEKFTELAKETLDEEREPNDTDVLIIQMHHRKTLASMISENPQEKQLILDANLEYVNEPMKGVR